MTLAPIDTPEQVAALRRRNRQLIAERLGWPNGAVLMCEDIETASPSWEVWWTDGKVGIDYNRRGYYATRETGHRRGQTVYGATPDDIINAICDADPWQKVTWGLPIDGII